MGEIPHAPTYSGSHPALPKETWECPDGHQGEHGPPQGALVAEVTVAFQALPAH